MKSASDWLYKHKLGGSHLSHEETNKSLNPICWFVHCLFVFFCRPDCVSNQLLSIAERKKEKRIVVTFSSLNLGAQTGHFSLEFGHFRPPVTLDSLDELL